MDSLNSNYNNNNQELSECNKIIGEFNSKLNNISNTNSYKKSQFNDMHQYHESVYIHYENEMIDNSFHYWLLMHKVNN